MKLLSQDYYVGNGMADATPGELFIEAWCHGGATETGEERPSLCTKLNLSQCYKNVSTTSTLAGGYRASALGNQNQALWITTTLP